MEIYSGHIFNLSNYFLVVRYDSTGLQSSTVYFERTYYIMVTERVVHFVSNIKLNSKMGVYNNAILMFIYKEQVVDT